MIISCFLISFILFFIGHYVFYNISFHLGLAITFASATFFMVPILKYMEDNYELNNIFRESK